MAKKLTFKLTEQEADGFVSIVNSLIQAYCDKYPEEHDFDEESIGYTSEGEIFAANGDDLDDVLDWVHSVIVPEMVQ